MSSTPAISIGRLGRVILAILAIFVILSCSIDDPFGIMAGQRATQRADDSTQRANLRATADALSTEAAEFHRAETALALEVEMHAAQTEEAAAAAVPPVDAPAAPAPQVAPPAPVSSPPVITKVDFLKSIPATGTKFSGWVSFTDPDGDVNLMTLEVISAETMKGSQGDPNKSLQGTRTDGRYRMQFWCYNDQEITMRVTLFDAAGNSSNSVDFSFECY